MLFFFVRSSLSVLFTCSIIHSAVAGAAVLRLLSLFPSAAAAAAAAAVNIERMMRKMRATTDEQRDKIVNEIS